MRKDKNACPGAATPKQADSKAFFQSDTLACSDSIAKDDCPSMGRIAEFLGHGSENAITTAEIRVLCNFASRRAARAEIARERENGVLICSSNKGIFLPSLDKEQRRQEIEQCLRTGEARASSFLKTLKHFRRALEQCTGQEVMWNEQSQEAIPEEAL